MTLPDQPQSLYDILGVRRDASENEIKRSYRQMAMALHPDRNQDDPLATEKFQRLSEAYEILKDPAKRERYDRFGIGDEVPTEPEDVEMFEVMTQILGLGRSRGVPKGDKVSKSIRLITISLKRAYMGGKESVKIDYHKICPLCHGVGSNNGVEYPLCQKCNGAGSLSPGGLQFLFPCRGCDSTGYIIPPACRCRKCRGRKLVREKKVMAVDVEVGIGDDEHIIIPNQGDEFPGKETADLVLFVQIKPDSEWMRDGDDLYYVKNLSVYEQIEGTAFTIKTLDDRELEVYTEEGKRPVLNRLKWIPNEGMPCHGNIQLRGNLFIVFEKGFPEPVHEIFRSIKNIFNRHFCSKILLLDAPEEKQLAYREYKKQIEEEREEQLRVVKELFGNIMKSPKPDQPVDTSPQNDNSPPLN